MNLKALLTGLSFSCALGLAQAQTPLLRWTFDEGSGAVPALDTGSGVASSGTFMGLASRTTSTPSGAGYAADFRTENAAAPYSHILGEDAAKLDGLGQLTLTTWLNVSAYPSGNHRLVAKQAATTFGGFNWGMNATPNDGTVGPDNFRLGLFLGNNISSAAANFTSAFSTVDVDAASKWVFLAVTYDNTAATDNVRFYIGGTGTAVSQLGTARTVAQLTVDGGAARFGVGFTDAAPTANTSVNGMQDDVRVYGTSLGLSALEAIRLEAVPEPSSFTLLAGGLAALLAFRRRA